MVIQFDGFTFQNLPMVYTKVSVLIGSSSEMNIIDLEGGMVCVIKWCHIERYCSFCRTEK